LQLVVVAVIIIIIILSFAVVFRCSLVVIYPVDSTCGQWPSCFRRFVLFFCFSPCRSALAGGLNPLPTVLLALRDYSPNLFASAPSYCYLLLILISQRLSSSIHFFLTLCISKFSQLCSFYPEDGGSNFFRNIGTIVSNYAV
jgi:hypothetical protein